MRKMGWQLLVAFVFAIPWEYSLDLGAPWGNAARVLGLLALFAMVPAVLQAGRIRAFGAQQWLVSALLAWWCISIAWSIDPGDTAASLPGYAQEYLAVWLVWELAETEGDLRALLRAYVAGAGLLALLTIGSFAARGAAGQARFVAAGQDPNDVARYLDLGFPLAAFLLRSESAWATRACTARAWIARALSASYVAAGFLAVLLTASRGGFIAAIVALAGSGAVLLRGRPLRARVALPGIVLFGMVAAIVVPAQTWSRIATIAQQVQGGDLNQRLDIWTAGWLAFVQAPLAGSGAGTFVAAASLSPIDTAHNTALSLAVEGGAMAVSLGAAILLVCFRDVLHMRGSLRIAMGTALLILLVSLVTATIERSRSTWLLVALISLGGRMALREPENSRSRSRTSAGAFAPAVSTFFEAAE